MKDILECVKAFAVAMLTITLIYLGGYHAGKADAQEEMQLQTAVAAARQGAKDYAKLSKAVDVQDGLHGDLERARAEHDRVRRALDAARAARPAGEHDGAGASGCQELLAKSVEILGECRERYLSCAGKHDAIAEIVK